MTTRAEHVLALVVELEGRTSGLSEPIPPSLATPALDLLLRCRAYGPAEVEAAGVAERLGAVDHKLSQLEPAFAEAAGRGLDLGRLRQRGQALLEDGAPDDATVRIWARDVLVASNLAPAIPVERGERARELVLHCLDLAGSDPRRFLGASSVVLDRFELEAPDGLDPFSARAHRAFESLPLEAVIDASVPALSEAKLRSLLDPISDGTVLREGLASLPAQDEPWIRAIRPREQQRGAGPPGPWWDRLMERAEDALQDARAWKQELDSLLDRCRQEGRVPCHAAGDPGEMVRLGRHLGGDWWLLHDAGGLWLQGPDREDVVVVARFDGREEGLEPSLVEGGTRWSLPTVVRWPRGLLLSVRVGPDSFEITLGEGNGQ